MDDLYNLEAYSDKINNKFTKVYEKNSLAFYQSPYIYYLNPDSHV